MSSSRLTVVRHGVDAPHPAAGETVISTGELKRWIRSGRILLAVRRWNEARLFTDRVTTLGRPLPTALAMRLVSRGACYAEDASGATRPLGAAVLGGWIARLVSEPFGRRALLAAVERRVAAFERDIPAPWPARLNVSNHPLYVRADVSFGLRAGGSVGHTAGVINELARVGAPLILLTTDRVPTINHAIDAHDIVPDEAFWNFRELPSFVMNAAVERASATVVRDRKLAFVYQRYALNAYAAVQVARDAGVPLVTEYNGSEIWIARHWGRPLKYEDLARRIERLNLRAAHLVSVVSRPLAREVEALGVAPHRISINPNGVDPERYRPDVDGARVRARYGFGDRTVIGFIGTFGPWHGAAVLAEAFVRLLSTRPQARDRIRLLWIGDGVELARVRRTIDAGGGGGACVFTGLVPQADGPAHLAACDILASPHVPNADGSPFFGSPTKLFEYMAMGRGIVASALDQIAEVLEHDRTAWLVAPGDVDALVAALLRLVEDPALRSRLGAEARRVVVSRYTWREHVRRMLDALCASTDGAMAPTGVAR